MSSARARSLSLSLHILKKTDNASPPQSLLDDIINTVNVLADRAIDSVEQLLVSIPPQKLGFSKKNNPTSSVVVEDDSDGGGSSPPLAPEDAARREIETGTHKLETLLTAAIDRNFDKLELYAMQNILTVQPRALRPYVQLSHYQGLDFTHGGTAGAGAAAPTTESITALRRRVQASQRLNLALQREKARNDALLKTLRDVVGAHQGARIKQEEGASSQEQPSEDRQQATGNSTFGFLHDKPSLSHIGSDTPISTTTEFTLSQLTALQALSKTLREMLPSLAAPPEEEGSKGSSWRRERVEYVEQSSRKYLENTSGLELGSQGEVRDGEYQGEGRNLGRGEVEGLEKVVAILGKSNKPAAGGEAEAEDDAEDAMDDS